MSERSSCDERLRSLLNQLFRDFLSLLTARVTNFLEPRAKFCRITAPGLTTGRRQEHANTIGESETEMGNRAKSEVRHRGTTGQGNCTHHS